MRSWPRWIAAATVAGAVLATALVWRTTREDLPRAEGIAGLQRITPPPAGASWAPRPLRSAGLSVLARASAGGFALATAHGPVSFLAGVNLGGTTPGHQPGELAITAEQYRAWFSAMGRLGVRVVRIYTIHPPAFYTELRRYNEGHPDAPLYLMQGVYLPDESYVRTGDLYAPVVTDAFRRELADAAAAAHGSLQRAPRRGRAFGTWSADVSGWLAGWIIGVEWDPRATAASDARNAAAPVFSGRYFSATPAASPTERWLAARMNDLAAAQAQRGRSAPIAFVNWPTTDPLRHPDEPLADEDLVDLDANRIVVRPAWPGGYFASYHAYPYYPDFQRHEPGLARYRYQGRADPYAGYLRALRTHHAKAGLPVLITEFGVPSSIGSAHAGPLGRDQGGHGERAAMRINARLLRLIKDVGTSGGLLFAWADEWFKFTWNTVTHQIPAERRQLWHDPLTNEQWFGLLAMDPTGRLNPEPRRIGGRGAVESVTVRVDEGYLHLAAELRRESAGPVTIGLDPVPAVTGRPAPGSSDTSADVALVLDPAARQGRLWIREVIDPVVLDRPEPRGDAGPSGGRAAAVNGWRPLQLITNRERLLPTTGRRLPAEFQDVGVLRWGSWAPGETGYDSRALWRVDGRLLRIRLPWAMAGLSDPSSHRALLPAAAGHTTPCPRLGLSVTAAGRTAGLDPITWNGWNRVGYRARLKDGAEHLRDALVAVS